MASTYVCLNVVLKSNVRLLASGGRVRHSFVSGKADGADATVVRPTNWNASHANSLFDPRDYGALADGSTDDTTAINSAITAANAAGGGDVDFGSGAILKAKAGAVDGDIIVGATGTTGTAVSLNANAALGATTITAATNPAPLAAGDYVLIRDATYAYGTTGRNQEINRIASVSGAGPFTFTLQARLIGNYVTASTAEVLKLTPVTDASIEGLSFQVATSNLAGGVGTVLSSNITVRQCRFTGTNQRPAIAFNQSAHCFATGNDIRDAQQISGNFGYGILVGASSHHIIATENYTENIRENPITDGSRLVVFNGNVCRSSYDDAINAHGTGVGRIVISNNIVSGSAGYGINVGFSSDNAPDRDVVVVGNFIEDTASTGILCDSAVGGDESYVLIANNVIRAWQGSSAAAIYVGVNSAHVNIIGNFCDGAGLANSQYGIQANGTLDTLIADNVIRNIGNGYGIVFGASTRITIQGNNISGISSNNVYSLGTNTTAIVRQNVADDSTVVRTAGERWEDNIWGTIAERNSGTASITTGGTIAHGIGSTPTFYLVQSTTSAAAAYVSAVDATNLTVTFGGGGTQVIKWLAQL